MYYQMLADLRDQYFSESDEEWQDYTEKILNHQMDLINDTKDNLKNALDEAQKAYDDAVEDGISRWDDWMSPILKVESTDIDGNKTEYYRPNDYSYAKQFIKDYRNTMLNLQGRANDDDVIMEVYYKLLDLDLEEGMAQAKELLALNEDEWNRFVSDTKEVQSLKNDLKDLYGYQEAKDLEKAKTEWEQFEKEWFEAFGTLPDKSYNIGVEMMQSIINGALSQIENFQSKVVEGMLSTFSGASIGINSISGSPATASAGGGDTYIINSPGSTIGESIRALKNQAAINRLRGY